jgi:hypothetical protein
MSTAFKATYSDWKLVKTRGVVQVIFEVPLADSDTAYEILGGMPNHANERWFGIAALGEQTDEKPSRQEWKDCSPSKQAGIRCSEPIFWAFLKEELGMKSEGNADNAATFVRRYCEVNSRAHFNTNHQARALWTQLDSRFDVWKAAERVGA